MSDLIIEVVAGHNVPESREFNGKVMWKQTAYAYLGGAYPAQIKFSIPDMSSAKPIGKYVILPGAFRVGKYGDLEINNFDMHKHMQLIADKPLK